MRKAVIQDVDLSQILTCDYDLVVFASGYEAQSTHIPSQMKRANCRKILVIGFEGVRDNDQRRQNDKYFDENWTTERLIMPADDEGLVYAELNRLVKELQGNREQVRVLVDYSSMSRLWYAALINWARFFEGQLRIEIDFLYSIGIYDNTLHPIVINEILAIPGFEGGSLRPGLCVAVFGLGFYGVMTQCVLELLEPDRVYAYLASPGAEESYPARVLASNPNLIDIAKSILKVPLDSVATTVRYLSEFIIPYLAQGDVVLIPMGPKPHVLAAMIVATTFQEVACMRVGARRERTENVPAHGPVVASRAMFSMIEEQKSVDEQKVSPAEMS